ncbi:MAG: hypothetical protein ACOCQP_03395, partial [Lentisphaeria bacterium]
MISSLEIKNESLTVQDDNSQLQALEEILMEASEGNLQAVNQILEVLDRDMIKPFGYFPEDVRTTWIEGIGLLTDNWEGEIPDAIIELVLKLAERNFECSGFRDFLARAMRTEFSANADPAGIITATGVYDKAIPTSDIADRWQRLRLLQEGVKCYHPHQGAGVIRDVDELAHEVKAKFARELIFQLHVVIQTFTFIIPDSPLDRLIAGAKLADISKTFHGEPAEVILGSCIPRPESIQSLKSLIVPSTMTETEFKALSENNDGGQETPIADEDKARDHNPTTAPSRPQIRSLEELKMQLQQDAITEPDEQTFSDIATVIGQACKRRKTSPEFVETIALLHNSLKSPERLIQILTEAGFPALVNEKQADFIKLLPKFSNTIIENWLTAYCKTTNVSEFTDFWQFLPLNLLSLGERAAAALDTETVEALRHRSMERIRKRNASSDIYVWLWNRNGKKECPGELRNYSLIFSILGQNARGIYQQANKQLKKLLLENADFQDFLTYKGDLDAASDLLSTARHSRSLGSGDYQTLTVRLAERYPELKSMLQKENAGTVSTKKTSPVTSRSSYEQKRKELNDIINIHIPANSRAIA